MKKKYICTFLTLVLSLVCQNTFSQNAGMRNQNVVVYDISVLLDSLYINGNYPKLLSIVEKVIDSKRKSNDVYSIDFAEMLMKKASALYRLEKPGAAEVGKEATLLVGKLIGKYNERYHGCVTSLATYCYAENMYPDCIMYENEALDIAEKLHLKVDYERLSVMCEGMSDRQLGVSKVFLIGRPMFDIFGCIIQGQNQEFNNLVSAKKAYEDTKKAAGLSDLEFANVEEKLALASIAVGDTATAQGLLFSATSRIYSSLGEDNIQFLRSSLLHADVLAIEGQTILARNQGEFILSKLEELGQEKTSLYIDALILVGMQYAHMGVNGSPQILKAMDISKEMFGTDSPEYDRARFAYAQILYRTLLGFNDIAGETLDKVINLTEETYSWRKTHLGLRHSDFIMSLLALATFYEQNKQYAKSTGLFAEFLECQSRIIKENFSEMSYEQQRKYWHLFNLYYQRSIPRVLWNEAMEGSTSVDASVCYNATLFSKGILQKSFTARHESETAGSNESYDRFINSLAYTWKDVKAHLKSGEAAIEFVSFKNHQLKIIRTASVENEVIHVIKRPVDEVYQAIYGALILTPELSQPLFVPLCDLNTAGDIEINGRVQSSMLYNIIWKPILPYLTNISTVYFSPSEDFYNIPLESLTSPKDNLPISDRFRLYRVSSTSILAQDASALPGKDAVIYGGINYDMTLSEMLNDKKNYLSQGFSEHISKASLLRGSREAIGEIEYLPGTLTEAQGITRCFNTVDNIIGHAKMVTGKNATETSLKALSGSGIKVIHIGTHGFYETKDHTLVTTIGDNSYSDEDRALMRSGLLFAGAQNFLDGAELPANVDDGILTSQEISYLDFYGLDLITLSACQTAQGDVTSDGIFGLQRGFKKAGANSILMSLWKVDDEATCKLMTEFYANWLSRKMKKHEAFEEAKKTIRNTPEWSDSKYWAAFILLDAIE